MSWKSLIPSFQQPVGSTYKTTHKSKVLIKRLFIHNLKQLQGVNMNHNPLLLYSNYNSEITPKILALSKKNHLTTMCLFSHLQNEDVKDVKPIQVLKLC